MLSPETDDYEQQLFIIVDNVVLLEVRSYNANRVFLLCLGYITWLT